MLLQCRLWTLTGCGSPECSRPEVAKWTPPILLCPYSLKRVHADEHYHRLSYGYTEYIEYLAFQPGRIALPSSERRSPGQPPHRTPSRECRDSYLLDELEIPAGNSPNVKNGWPRGTVRDCTSQNASSDPRSKQLSISNIHRRYPTWSPTTVDSQKIMTNRGLPT